MFYFFTVIFQAMHSKCGKKGYMLLFNDLVTTMFEKEGAR